MAQGLLQELDRVDLSSPDMFSLEHLLAFARELASQLELATSPQQPVNLFERVEKSQADIVATYNELTAATRRGWSVTRDSEWLLDNFYVVEEQLQEIEEDLPPPYFAELPKLTTGEPRVYQLAKELILHTDGLVDESMIVGYVQAFQEITPLTIGEVWAVPTMLRISLIEQLGRLTREMHRCLKRRESARNLLATWTEKETFPAALQAQADEFLLVQLLVLLEDSSLEDAQRYVSLERLLLNCHPGLHESVRDFHQLQAASQVSIGNVITAMRLISALDWVAFFERCSLVERILRSDPTQTYAEMDYESRDRYLHVLEHLAKRTNISEVEIASTAIKHATEVQDRDRTAARKRHVGYWLVDHGRKVLESELGYQQTLWEKLVRHAQAHGLPIYGGTIGVMTVGLTAVLLGVGSGWSYGLMLTLALPLAVMLSDFAVGMVNYLTTRIIPPRLLSKLELRDGVPSGCRTFVVVPSLLTRLEDVEDLLRRLELHYIANAEPQLSFALLTDFGDAPQQSMPADQELIDAARTGIAGLNKNYGTNGRGPFYLFHRQRQWNARENCWMGWERKRGKLMEFHRLLSGKGHTTYTVQEGHLANVIGADALPVRYIITCDADTQLPHGAARRLIGTLAHPLNRVCFQGSSCQVVAGYSLVQPRVSVALADSRKSWFVQIMANSRGIDPYATSASDVYQDLFGEGSFTGKGIYDVEAFDRCLSGTFRDNQILSHDLIEGCHLRTALATDIEVIDGYPARYDADAKRQHRWVRGDWQISPWLLPWVPCEQGMRENRLSWLSRWKIADNLRRSLVPPAILITMLLGWYQVPSLAWMWSLAGLLCLITPACVTLVASLDELFRARDWSTGLQSAFGNLRQAVLQSGILIVSLPHRAAMMIDAILRTLWRLLITRKHLLEWQSAATTDRLLRHRQMTHLLQYGWVSASAVALMMTLPGSAIPAVIPWIIAWFFSPVILELISLPRQAQPLELDDNTRRWLRHIARRNWSYFEQTLGPDSHWLPPDNVQEYPRQRIANRLSPTNEGLFLVSVLAARDFGFLSLHDAIQYWERNLQSLSQLPKAGGHFFNWYDTTSLLPLRPRYLSTVDSGNLAASLLVVRRGIRELQESAVLTPAIWQGLDDTVAVAKQALTAPSEISAVSAQQEELDAVLRDLHNLCARPPGTLWDLPGAVSTLRDGQQQIARMELHSSVRLQNPQAFPHEIHSVQHWVDGFLQDYQRLYSWVELITDIEPSRMEMGSRNVNHHAKWHLRPECCHAWKELKEAAATVQTLTDLISLEQRLAAPLGGLQTALSWEEADTQNPLTGRQWISRFVEAVRSCGRSAAEVRRRLLEITDVVERHAAEMDFAPLYDPLRRLFSIGYNLDEGKLDGAHYDLLCSEARLTSYLAVARGDVPVKHWFRLGRQTTYAAGQVGLLSWGGTMFEFLMPLLFQPRIEGSLLTAACETAVEQQRDYAHRLGLPWGVSESAFASFSPNSDYQYQSFGVPGLGLKRGLSKDRVVAPYATMLALEINPSAAIRNLRRLESEGLLGRWGFYEAIDYTPSRLPVKKSSAIVKCFMAHHQGMSFLSLANLLNDEGVRRRFRSDPFMKAAELLLQEGVPVSSPMALPHADEVSEARIVRPLDHPVVSRRIGTYETLVPRTHLLSNGSYAVMLTNAGSGYSCWNDLAITRWRSDVTRDHWGQWLYISDPRTSAVWSAGFQPTLSVPDQYEVIFSIDKAEIRRRDGDLESCLEVTVSPEDAMEVRQLKLRNLGKKPRTIEVTSYAEIVLTKAAADLAHPAFQKLFVETEYLPEYRAILAHRRPRDAGEPILWAVHVLCAGDSEADQFQWETSRAKFLGRGRTACHPLALDSGQELSGTTGPVLDPIFSLRCRLSIPAEDSCRLTILTGFAESREQALKLADLYRDQRTTERVFELAWAFNQMELQHWRTSAARTHSFQQLAASVLYPHSLARGKVSSLSNNRLNQSALWSFGISGDLPIVLIRIDQARQLRFVEDILIAQDFWAYRQLHVDLIILNCLSGSYLDELQEQVEQLVRDTPRQVEFRPGRAYVIQYAQLAEEQRDLFETVAAVVLDASLGWSNPSMQTQPQAVSDPVPSRPKPHLSDLRPSNSHLRSVETTGIGSRFAPELEFWNGFGGFADEGREYWITSQEGQVTPMPWCNVIANARFGCLVTESGGGYTWSENSRENKLTTWSNDPISDIPSEQLYLGDSSGEEIWPIFGGTVSQPMTRTVQHGCGWSRWTWSIPGLTANITVSIASDDPVKFIEVQLQNQTSEPRELSLAYYAELVLGVCREQTQRYLVTEVDDETDSLFIRNTYHPDFPDQIVFMHAICDQVSLTGDRASFLGRHSNAQYPAGFHAAKPKGCIGPGLDPCGVLQAQVQLGAQKMSTVTFLLGRGADRTEAIALLQRYSRTTDVVQAHIKSREQWENILGAIEVETPNRAFDLLINRWAIYQVLSCRLWGRSAFYQASGAYGFRDQLQDVAALVYTRPHLVREHILRAASRQYLEGDVQHWWHTPSGRGTRTRFSDDLLWLVYTSCHYFEVTGDDSLWNESVAFLESPVLSEDEQERYELPHISEIKASLYEHCLRALSQSFRLGQHGLPLMGCGDWNDGMNIVGAGGRGESVWVGWFLVVLCDNFLPVMDLRGDHALADHYREKQNDLMRQLEQHGWDGEWYRRAFFDDGTPLGSHTNTECQIDSISQSWAVFAKADEQRTTTALDAVMQRLVRPQDHLVALLTPPFDESTPNPGYIAGYVKGVRENGGQYTHAALWLVQALAEKGMGDQALAIFDLINPIRQASTKEDVLRYQVEPYVLAADVYSVSPHTGRGGWTWYTGSAAWAYRAAIESLLGLRLRGREVSFDPCVPENWPHFNVTLRVGESSWKIQVQLSVNGSTANDISDCETQTIELFDDGKDHAVTLYCRRRDHQSNQTRNVPQHRYS